MNLRHTFKKGLRWTIGNGSTVSNQFDNWLFPFPIVIMYVPEDIVYAISRIFLISNGILDKLVWGLFGSWRVF